MTIEHKSPEQLDEIAREIVTGRYFVPASEEDMRLGFGLMLSMILDRDRHGLDDCGCVLGDMNSTLERTINGVPMFTRVVLIHKDNIDALDALVKTKHEAIMAALEKK